MQDFDKLVKLVDREPTRTVAVAVAQDRYVIEAISRAKQRNIADAILVGDEPAIGKVAAEMGVPLGDTVVVHQPDPIRDIDKAIEAVSSGKADILMKGHVHTDDFLRGVLDRDHGLRTGSIMSHVFVVEMRSSGKLLFITDGAMNIAPDLEQKAAILLNAVYLAGIFGLQDPRVAVLAAIELVNPKMPATQDAAALGAMANRGQYVPHCVVDGPFALDNAISAIAARHKNITGPVAGQADILVVPDIEAGNILAKSLVYFAGCRIVGLLVGAKAPVVLTSRADSAEAKLLSIAAAVLMVNVDQALQLKIGKVHY